MTIRYYAPHIKDCYFLEDKKGNEYTHFIPRRNGITGENNFKSN